MKYVDFHVYVQCHDQAPIDTPAFRPTFARTFPPDTTLEHVWNWVHEVRQGDIEWVKLIPTIYNHSMNE